jgi:hypothetical protein
MLLLTSIEQGSAGFGEPKAGLWNAYVGLPLQPGADGFL